METIALGSDKGVQKKRPTVKLHVELKKNKDGSNEQKIIDFTKLAEEKYGKEAIYPGFANIDLTALDVDDDDDNDDVVDADGDVDLEKNQQQQQQPQQPKPKPKNRGRVEGKYDLEDPFIDDTEMAWEEQAASTADGFFVYQGPLQAAVETKPEKPEGERKKPGPPKGYKRGSNPKKAAASNSTSAASKASKNSQKSEGSSTSKNNDNGGNSNGATPIPIAPKQ